MTSPRWRLSYRRGQKQTNQPLTRWYPADRWKETRPQNIGPQLERFRLIGACELSTNNQLTGCPDDAWHDDSKKSRHGSRKKIHLLVSGVGRRGGGTLDWIEMLVLFWYPLKSSPGLVAWLGKCEITLYISRPRWLSWMRRPTGDQEVAGSTPAEVGNILSWRLIVKYFLRSFSPFRWFKKGSCQFLAKECAQYWLTA